jgi:hypothetical protein
MDLWQRLERTDHDLFSRFLQLTAFRHAVPQRPLHIEEVDPADGTTPARVREIHREQLAKLSQNAETGSGC